MTEIQKVLTCIWMDNRKKVEMQEVQHIMSYLREIKHLHQVYKVFMDDITDINKRQPSAQQQKLFGKLQMALQAMDDFKMQLPDEKTISLL